MAINRVVTPENLNTEHFQLDSATQKINVIFPATGDVAGTVKNLTFNNIGKKITWTQDGQDKEHDMTAFLNDIHVTGATLTAGVLKLEAEGQPTISVDLNALTSVNTANSANINFTGDGSSGSPLSASLNKSAVFDTELQDAFAVRIGYITSSNA